MLFFFSCILGSTFDFGKSNSARERFEDVQVEEYNDLCGVGLACST